MIQIKRIFFIVTHVRINRKATAPRTLHGNRWVKGNSILLLYPPCMSINNSQVLTILLLKTGKEADCLYFSVYIFLLKHLVLEIDFSVNWLIFEQNFLDIDRYLLLLPPPPLQKNVNRNTFLSFIAWPSHS